MIDIQNLMKSYHIFLCLSIQSTAFNCTELYVLTHTLSNKLEGKSVCIKTIELAQPKNIFFFFAKENSRTDKNQFYGPKDMSCLILVPAQTRPKTGIYNPKNVAWRFLGRNFGHIYISVVPILCTPLM